MNQKNANMLTRASSIKAMDFFRAASTVDDDLVNSLDAALGFRAEDPDREPAVRAVRDKPASAAGGKKPRDTPMQVVTSAGPYALYNMHI